MTPILIAAILLFLLVVIIDLYKKAVPSILGTGILLVFAVVNSHNLPFAIAAAIFALLLYEAGIYKGVADIKMIAAIGFLLPSTIALLAFIIVLSVFTPIYNALQVYVLKNKGDYAGTLPIFLSFLALFPGGLS